jgi:hypothetical protein
MDGRMPGIEFIYFILCLWAAALVVAFALTSKHGYAASKKAINFYYMTKAFILCGKKGVRDFKKQLDAIITIDNKMNDSIESQARSIKDAVTIDRLLDAQQKMIDAVHMAHSINSMKIHGIDHAEVVAVIKDGINTMTPYERKKIIQATHCFHDGKNLFFVTDEKKVVH